VLAEALKIDFKPDQAAGGQDIAYLIKANSGLLFRGGTKIAMPPADDVQDVSVDRNLALADPSPMALGFTYGSLLTEQKPDRPLVRRSG
jgi:hypothetical protein